MQLTYSIPGRLYWIKDLLPEDVYTKIRELCIKQKNKMYSMGADYGNVFDYCNPPKTTVEPGKGFRQLEDTLPDSRDLWQELKTQITHNPYHPIEGKKLAYAKSQIHMLEKNSGIQWHTGKWNNGTIDTYHITYYLNDQWDKKWGGEYMYSHEDIRGYIPPTGNSLVLMKTPLWHKVNTVLSPEIPRLSIQLFTS